jgi:glucuronate isomerase
VDALGRRHQDFHDMGGRLSDHGLAFCPGPPSTEDEAAATFDQARAGRAVGPMAQEGYAAYLMHVFGRLDAGKGWTKQLHLGARRNVRTRAFEARGRDVGHDSMGDWRQVEALAAYLDRLDREEALPKVIIYNNNPSDNYALATMAGNFQDEGVAGKIQFGSGWWHLDQKEGMEWQMNALSNTGLLSTFIGMTTDSRSFLSYPRHEYFRRVFCNLVGRDVERGELPVQDELVGRLVEDVCYRNAVRYFGWELG